MSFSAKDGAKIGAATAAAAVAAGVGTYIAGKWIGKGTEKLVEFIKRKKKESANAADDVD